MTNRPTTYHVDVTVNRSDGSEYEHQHNHLDFESLMSVLDDHVFSADHEVTSFVFNVVRHVPKDWVVVGDPTYAAEVFGPFPDRDKAIEWVKSEFPTDTDWIVRAIDKPIVDKPKQPFDELRDTLVGKEATVQLPNDSNEFPVDEQSLEYFNRHIAGDR